MPAPTNAPTTAPRRRGSHRRRWLAIAIVALVVVVGAWSVLTALAAKDRLSRVRTDLLALRAHPPATAALDARLAVDLREATAARALVHQFGPTLVSYLPLVGRTLAAERAVADASVGVLRAGRLLVTDTTGLSTGGRIDLARLAITEHDLRAAAAALDPSLRALADVHLGWTPGFVAREARLAQTRLDGSAVALRAAADLTDVVRGLLGGSGPRQILVALENNAELRGTGGLVSAFALGTGSGGRLRLGPFRDVESVATLDPARAIRVPAPASYVRHYGAFLANSTIWKNATMSPDVPTSAAVLAEIAAVSLHVRPDAVILIDVPAMATVVSTTGPLRLPNGAEVSGDALVHALLIQSYGAATSDQDVQTARRHALERVAGAAFARVIARAPTLTLLRALASAVAGRHLLLWSARPVEEQLLRAAGAAGAVDPGSADLAMVTIQNLGDSPGFGNKLDVYASRRLAVAVRVGRTVAEVTQTLTLANNAPTGLGPYVAGLRHPGQLTELVDLAAAAGARIESFEQDGRPVGAELLTENGSIRVSTLIVLPRGQQTTLTLSYRLPIDAGSYRLVAIPQPLAEPATLTISVTAAPGVRLDGALSRTGPWTGIERVLARLHRASGLERWREDVAHFWTHRVRL